MFKKERVNKKENIAENLTISTQEPAVSAQTETEPGKKKKKAKEKVLRKKRKNSGKKVIASFILAILLFLALLIIQTGVLSDYEKTTVVVTKKSIEKNTDIVKGNVSEYFDVKETNVLDVPENYLSSTDSLINMRISRDLDGNSIVTSTSVKKQNDAIDNISVPAEASFKVDSSAQVIGGTLRTGDIINIQALTKDGNGNVAIAGTLNNIYVSKVFTSSGEGLGVEDSGVALTINVIIDASAMETYNTIISSGTIRVIRLSDETIANESLISTPVETEVSNQTSSSSVQDSQQNQITTNTTSNNTADTTTDTSTQTE